jgi:hypothetical protein
MLVVVVVVVVVGAAAASGEEEGVGIFHAQALGVDLCNGTTTFRGLILCLRA